MLSIVRVLTAVAFACTLAGCGDEGSSAGGGGPGAEATFDCFVSFAITNDSVFSDFDALVHHGRAPGGFIGAGENVECSRLDTRLAMYTTNWNCTEAEGCYAGNVPILKLQALVDHDVVGPIDLTECRFGGTDVPVVADFDIEVTNASKEDFTPSGPWPVIEITGIECRDTTVTTTSTTLPDPCADVSCDSGEVCSDGSCLPVSGYEIDFGVDNDAGFGSLQLEVAYDCEDGTFDGEHGDVRCRVNPALNAHVAFNDMGCEPVSREGQLNAGFIHATEFRGPGVLATCEYTSVGPDAPSGDEFEIVVVDAADRYFAPVDARVSVHAVRPIAR